jgi:hypothetical protein
MSQTAYSLTTAAAMAGMKADAQFDYVESHPAQAAVGFGLGVVRHAAGDDRVRLPAGADASAAFMGIALHEQKESLIGYLANDSVNVLRRGKAWVLVNDTVADGEPAFVVNAVGDFGKFRNDNTNAIVVPTGVFRSAAVSGGIAIVEINIP